MAHANNKTYYRVVAMKRGTVNPKERKRKKRMSMRVSVTTGKEIIMSI